MPPKMYKDPVAILLKMEKAKKAKIQSVLKGGQGVTEWINRVIDEALVMECVNIQELLAYQLEKLESGEIPKSEALGEIFKLFRDSEE
jgi:hypothetical protein